MDIPYSEVTPGGRIRNAVSEAGLKVSEHPTLLSSGYLTANLGPDPDYKDLAHASLYFCRLGHPLLRFDSPLHKAETESGLLGVGAQLCDVGAVLLG